MSNLALQVCDLAVRLGGAVVLDGVSLSLPAGRTLALLGPSGCGKTTLLRTIAGLQAPEHGMVCLGGRDVTGVAPERRGVGMVFQDGALFPHMDVAGNVGFGLDRRERKSGAVDDVLEMVGLRGFGQRMPGTLSGGQQQRVALARALVTRPDVILLDEPFSSLDAGLRTQVRAEVAALLKELSITAVVVTHDQEEAFLLGDEVAVMIGGRIHQQAPPAAIYAAPATREVALFLGDANMVAGDAHGLSVITWLGEVPLQVSVEGRAEVLLRPEDLRIVPGGELAVEAVEYYGHDAVTVLHGPEGAIRVRSMSLPPFSTGDKVALEYSGPPAMGYPA